MAAHTTESLTLPVLGMTCASCQHHVEEALRATAGVEQARVDLMAHRASVVFDPALAAPEQLVEAIRGAGYDAVLPRAGEGAGHAEDAPAGADLKAWVTLAAGAAAMLLAMPLGTEMGARGSLADAPVAVALCAAGGWVALVSAGDDGGGCGVGGARDLCERHSRAAPRRNQHEHAGEPGDGRGVCLFGLCDDCARAGTAGLFRRGAADSGISVAGQEPGRPGEAAGAGGARFAFAAAAGDARGAWWMACRRWCRSKRCGPATASWCCPASAFRWTRRLLKGAPRWMSRC